MARNILLIGKSDMLRKILQTRIMANIDDAVIAEAATIKEAKKHIDSQTCHIALYSWDVTDSDGLNFISILKEDEKTKELPCIFLIDEEKYIEEAVSAGVKHYLKMPCPSAELTASINEICPPISLRKSRRFSMPNSNAHLAQRHSTIKANVLNVSAGGMLLEMEFYESYDFSAPVMLSVEFEIDGEQVIINDLYSVMTTLKVINRFADHTLKRVRMGFSFLYIPGEAQGKLDAILKIAEENE